MRVTRLRSKVKSAVAILSAACFLTVSLGSVSRAVAADAFETWPKKTAEPGVEPTPKPDEAGKTDTFESWPKKTAEPGVEPQPATNANGAADAGGTAGKNVEKGSSSGTIGWIAAGAAAILLIAVAAGGGGGGGGTTSNH